MAQYNVFVDERYSPIFEENLFKDGVLIPNITYTTRWQGDAAAGAVKIQKITKGAVDKTGKGITSGFDLTDVGATTLLTLALDKPYSRSTAIFGVEVNSVSGDLAGEYLKQNVLEVQEAWTKDGMDALVTGATQYEGASAAEDITTNAILKAKFIKVRTLLRATGARANTMVANSSVYGLMLTDGVNFIPATNETRNETGLVGKYYGVNVFEYMDLKDKDTNNTTEFVLYDYNAFAIATNLETIRIADGAPNIVGSFSQVAINSGFLLTNADRAYVSTVYTA